LLGTWPNGTNNNESDFSSALLNVFRHVHRNVEYLDIELCDSRCKLTEWRRT